MALFTFTIHPDGGEPYELEATSRDVLNWERTGKNASLKRLMEDLHLADLYQVAYFAATRQGRFTGTRADFESGVDLTFEVEDSDADPSRTGA